MYRKALLIVLALAAASVVAESSVPAELRITVAPDHPRPFLLANRSGTYFYGSTSESAWDSGWMGLWVNRKRVQPEFRVVDSTGQPVSLSDAQCVVTPFDVVWTWSNPRRDLCLFFVSTQNDTLYYRSESGLRIQGGAWIRPLSDDDEYQKQVFQWAASSDSRAQPPDGYLPERLRDELSSLPFRCSDPEFTNAVAWAHIQLLFLLAEQDSLLYAGIPWFNEGWGRDTFISLPGLLVTGHTDAARKILMRYAAWVDRNPRSPAFGRVPNRVRPGEEIAYNTADGTPWWILGVYYYGVYARDFDLWSHLVAEPSDSDNTRGAVTVAIEGALARSDSLGFLKHGDADTWMDAVGPSGAVTPRGDRAVEIQALHYASLDAAIRMATLSRKAFPQETLQRWREARSRLEKTLIAGYLNSSGDGLWDHLNPNGSPDSLVRPNQLFALSVPLSPIVPPVLEPKIVRHVCRELVHDYGVLSLSPNEENFHPFHQDEHYPKDDAYHTGIVWTWLSGPAKSLLTKLGRGDLTLKMADYEVALIAERGCVGSLPEVTDAMPRKGSKAVASSGTVSQAWSLAEFLRTTYQDILGIRPVFVSGRVEPFWLVDPRIPESWGKVEFRVSLEGTPVRAAMQNFGDSIVVTLQAEVEPRAPLGIKAFHAERGITGYLNGTEPVRLVYRKSEGIAYADGVPTAQVELTGWPYDSGPQDIAFAPSLKMRDWPSLRPPKWDVLTAKQVKYRNDGEKRIAIQSDDAVNDKGDGSYIYPLNENFKSGILDIMKFEVTESGRFYNFRLWFRNLVQPGWHPEYGFQLTFAAICLHTPDGKRTDVGANSNYTFPDSSKFSRIIYVGGGLRIEDDQHNVLAAFTPRILSDAIGDTSTKIISFSLPRKYFPSGASDGGWTVLVGAQNDHGGAGMGEFRAVKPVAEEWAGGGNLNNGPNVYDIMPVPEKAKRPDIYIRWVE